MGNGPDTQTNVPQCTSHSQQCHHSPGDGALTVEQGNGPVGAVPRSHGSQSCGRQGVSGESGKKSQGLMGEQMPALLVAVQRTRQQGNTGASGRGLHVFT